MSLVFITPKRTQQQTIINSLKSKSFALRVNQSLAVKNGVLWTGGRQDYTGRAATVTYDTTMYNTGITNVSGVYCGNGHSFMIKDDGTLWATGYGTSGFLGQGNTNDSLGAWIQVNIPETVVKVMSHNVDYHIAVALTASGNVYTWGTDDGNTGAFGTGQTGGTQYTPTKITQFYDGSSFGNVVDVEVTRKTIVFLHADGSISICGMSSGNSFAGESGPPSLGGAFNKPYKITVISAVDAIAGVYEGGCFCLKGTNLYFFGQCSDGQLGDGVSGTQQIAPPTLLNSTTAKIFSEGSPIAFRISTSNKLQGTGTNTVGALGFASTSTVTTWTDIIGTFDELSVPAIAAALAPKSFVRTANGVGNLYFSGNNSNGTGGQGANTDIYKPHTIVPGFSVSGSWYQADALVAVDANVGADIQNAFAGPTITKLNQSWGGTGSYPALNATEHKFGTKSIGFSGPGGLRFGIAQSIMNTLGTTDFTIHYWVKSTNNSTGAYHLIPFVKYTYAGASGTGYHSISLPKSSNNVSIVHNNSGAGSPTASTTISYSTAWLNAWHHVALVYKASTRTLTFYYDGVSKATVGFSTNPVATSGLPFDCTMYDSGTFYMDRYEVVPRVMFNANFNPATDLYV